MKSTYKVTVVESISYRQYVGFVEAESEQEAKDKAVHQFIKEKPIYSAHVRICMCHKLNNAEQNIKPEIILKEVRK